MIALHVGRVKNQPEVFWRAPRVRCPTAAKDLGAKAAPSFFAVGCALAAVSKERVCRSPRHGRGKALAVSPAQVVAVSEKNKDDQRLSLYHRTGNVSPICQQQKEELARRAVEVAGGAPGTACTVDVHYSWACLERLQQARELGRSITVDSVLLPGDSSEEQVALAQRCAPVVFSADKSLMASDFANEGSRKNNCHFVAAFPVSQQLSVLKPPYVVLDGIGSSHNIGQILRTAYHFGIDSVILSQEAWQQLDARACRVAVGWAYHMDFHMAHSLPEALQALCAQGVTLYAAEDSASSEEVRPHAPRDSELWGLVLGHEVSPEVLARCDFRVRAPQRLSGTMNVAHAAAICLYELAGLGSQARADPTATENKKGLVAALL
ncbi:unnamed protein product [Polarella glacialis]|uniref:tRNA/rRNA methyltransferase SpoU type domain-containing protein n=1 Tax=Polarella glacialis TaxID=89957 RepID=A0A813FP25_POLGL|nr:unnamed protein product [Polarella glacialis]